MLPTLRPKSYRRRALARRSVLFLAVTAAMGAAAASESHFAVLDKGVIRWDGTEQELLGIEPAGDHWKERWREALDYTDWSVQEDGNGWELARDGLKLTKLLLAMEAAIPTDDASPEIKAFAKQIKPQTQGGVSSTAFDLDGHLYTPVLSTMYQLQDGLVIIHTGRNLYCHSQGNSAGHPVPNYTAIIDGRIVPLDGRPGVSAFDYGFTTDIIQVRSSHADMWCGDPDTVRITMHAPDFSAPGLPATWTMKATNHSEEPVSDLIVTTYWEPGGLELTAPAGCSPDNNQITCTRSSLAAGQSWEREFQVTGPLGPVLAHCQGTMATPGRLSDENCWDDSVISEPVELVASRSGPASVEVGIPFIWSITLFNTGWAPAEDVTVVDLTIPGDSISFVDSIPGVDTCSASSMNEQTSVTCGLDSPLPAGRSHTIYLIMKATELGVYDVSCEVSWSGGQMENAQGCQSVLTVTPGDLLFRSRFQP